MADVVELTNHRMCGDSIFVVGREGSNSAGQAMWRIQFLACGHQEVRNGHALRRAHRAGKRLWCFGCGKRARLT